MLVAKLVQLAQCAFGNSETFLLVFISNYLCISGGFVISFNITIIGIENFIDKFITKIFKNRWYWIIGGIRRLVRGFDFIQNVKTDVECVKENLALELIITGEILNFAKFTHLELIFFDLVFFLWCDFFVSSSGFCTFFLFGVGSFVMGSPVFGWIVMGFLVMGSLVIGSFVPGSFMTSLRKFKHKTIIKKIFAYSEKAFIVKKKHVAMKT